MEPGLFVNISNLLSGEGLGVEEGYDMCAFMC